MGANTTITVDELTVAPGSEITTAVRVRNNGTVVDQYDLEVLGDAAGWTSVQPTSISLLPGLEQTVQIAFRPSKSSAVPAGRTTFAVKASSHEDPHGSSVAEGTIDVLPYDDRAAELVPRASRGRRSGTHEVAVDNRGNAPITVDLSATDPEGTMRFEFDPPQLTVEPGTVRFSTLRVRPAKMFWRGPNKSLPFAVFVSGDDHAPLPLDGSMVQQSILPKWFWKAVFAALALAVILAVLWFALVKPQIKTSAQEVTKPIDDRLDAASIPTLPSGGDNGAGGGGAPTTTTTTTPTTEPPTATTTATGGGLESVYGKPVVARLAVSSDNPSAAYSVPDGQTLALTDMILQNPQGDFGRITVTAGDTVLLDIALDTLAVHDEHTIAPVIVPGGSQISVSMTCTAPGDGAASCSDGVTIFGFQQ